jgi:hypothetical protein
MNWKNQINWRLLEEDLRDIGSPSQEGIEKFWKSRGMKGPCPQPFHPILFLDGPRKGILTPIGARQAISRLLRSIRPFSLRFLLARILGEILSVFLPLRISGNS